MNSFLATDLWSNIIFVFVFGIISIISLVEARKHNFLRIFHAQKNSSYSLSLIHALIFFGAYFATSFIITPIFFRILRLSSFQGNIPFFLGNFFNTMMIFSLFTLFFMRSKSNIRREIWLKKSPFSLRKDLSAAILCWIIAFPIIIFYNHLFEIFKLLLLPKTKLSEQIAVSFLKQMEHDIVIFILAAFLIVCIVPIIEEVLFRGIFQTILRKYLSPSYAIIFSSLFFAIFHYSPLQGIANIIIIGSLFIFSLFLGFIYEKRGSLFSSIALHGIFNFSTIINLYFLN
ncbi:MAG: CPBP family intramembrane metalloprotease [Parachlamydiales bacterium]|nr:CPBP family intramembrane metalloprotease [Parachlamydiales bacterium]